MSKRLLSRSACADMVDSRTLHIGMGAQEIGQAGLQPLGREAVARGDDERTSLRLRRHQRRGFGDDAHRMLDLARIGAARAGQDRAAGMALEQRHAQELLELLDLVADRRRRDAQFLGTLSEAAVPRGGFEGQQRLERRQARTAGAPDGEIAGEPD